MMRWGCHPVLIIEGPGDTVAVPSLISMVCQANQLDGVWPRSNPITRQNIPKLTSNGELERFVRYALVREGDSVLVVLDTDGACIKTVVGDWIERIGHLLPNKRIGIAFLRSEFESLFLYCLDKTAERFPEYGWRLDGWNIDDDHEAVIGAKGALSRRMTKGRAYKETRDQLRFVSALDVVRLRERSRSFAHFEKTVRWLAGGEGGVYPEGV